GGRPGGAPPAGRSPSARAICFGELPRSRSSRTRASNSPSSAPLTAPPGSPPPPQQHRRTCPQRAPAVPIRPAGAHPEAERWRQAPPKRTSNTLAATALRPAPDLQGRSGAGASLPGPAGWRDASAAAGGFGASGGCGAGELAGSAALAGGAAVRLRDVDPVVGVRAGGGDGQVGAVPAAGDQQAEVGGRAGDGLL